VAEELASLECLYGAGTGEDLFDSVWLNHEGTLALLERTKGMRAGRYDWK
jgi:hypothetical protein